TAGSVAVARMMQKREQTSSSGTYLGKGKLEELKELIAEVNADGIICDDELSPAELRNLTDILGCKIVDRTMLINSMTSWLKSSPGPNGTNTIFPCATAWYRTEGSSNSGTRLITLFCIPICRKADLSSTTIVFE
ncbi:MAG: hypothetical protein IIU45_04245, partial [Lachnospiraceae bacterium]|nr:hypothetical protein [Lachnospiraceae bacterium]